MSEQSEKSGSQFALTDKDLHPHLSARMLQRGVSRDETQRTLNEGWEAKDAKPGTTGRVMVLPYYADWEGVVYQEKEVTVYYRSAGAQLVVLTVKARYGSDFPRGNQK